MEETSPSLLSRMSNMSVNKIDLSKYENHLGRKHQMIRLVWDSLANNIKENAYIHLEF